MINVHGKSLTIRKVMFLKQQSWYTEPNHYMRIQQSLSSNAEQITVRQPINYHACAASQTASAIIIHQILFYSKVEIMLMTNATYS